MSGPHSLSAVARLLLTALIQVHSGGGGGERVSLKFHKKSTEDKSSVTVKDLSAYSTPGHQEGCLEGKTHPPKILTCEHANSFERRELKLEDHGRSSLLKNNHLGKCFPSISAKASEAAVQGVQAPS